MKNKLFVCFFALLCAGFFALLPKTGHAATVSWASGYPSASVHAINEQVVVVISDPNSVLQSMTYSIGTDSLQIAQDAGQGTTTLKIYN